MVMKWPNKTGNSIIKYTMLKYTMWRLRDKYMFENRRECFKHLSWLLIIREEGSQVIMKLREGNKERICLDKCWEGLESRYELPLFKKLCLQQHTRLGKMFWLPEVRGFHIQECVNQGQMKKGNFIGETITQRVLGCLKAKMREAGRVTVEYEQINVPRPHRM